jgi:cytochrome c-type biogenesis protein CcmH/NrfG
MANSREIEKLERLWKDNPQGTVFAPFAEALRKDGQLMRAREVLEQGLQYHPDHIPANIVFGRCCLDLQEISAAEGAFTRVLGLDPENVIALKALADITERQARYAEADQWIQQLIAVDPSNDDAREQAERVAAAREQAAAQLYAPLPEPEPVAEVEPPRPAPAAASAGAIEGGEDTLVVERASTPSLTLGPPASTPVAHGQPSAPPEYSVADATTLPIVPALSGQPSPPPASPPPDLGVHVERELSPAERWSQSSLEAKVGPDDLVIREEDHDRPAALPHLPAGGGRAGRAEEFGVEVQEEIVINAGEGTEYQTPTASDQFLKGRGEPPEREPAFEPEAPAPEPVEEAEPAAAEAAEPSQPLELIYPEDTPVAARAAESPDDGMVREPDLVVTETMADLYMRQGHRQEAAQVYRQLLARSPHDDRLRARLAEAEGRAVEGHGEIITGQWAAYSSSVTGGESVAAFFLDMLSRRPAPGSTEPGVPTPAAPEDENPGAPTRPASNALSLSAIFGEEASQGPPVVPPNPEGGSASSSGSGSPAFSFDQFFSGTPSLTSDSGEGSETGGQGGGGKASGLEEDLDQFQNWLKSLKR